MFPFIPLQQLWLQNIQIATEVPQVIGQRFCLFSQPWWSANTMAEHQTMYWEKVAAIQEITAIWWLFCYASQQQKPWPASAHPYRYWQWLSDAVNTANHALYSLTRRVHANRQRLNQAI